MSLLLETIKVKNRKLVNVAYHNTRLNTSRNVLLGVLSNWDLSSIIKVPDHITEATYKCRVEYGRDIELIEFIPYHQRVIEKLYLIQADKINYYHKYTDRKVLDELKSRIGDAQNSDILIVKEGLITDTSYSNIVLFNGTSWVTPDSPLLAGTKRKFYLDHHIIHEEKVKSDGLERFSRARLINAMIDLNESTDIPVENIISFS